eukprot:8168886-Lingulodinium_polyedra.AAC.1
MGPRLRPHRGRVGNPTSLDDLAGLTCGPDTPFACNTTCSRLGTLRAWRSPPTTARSPGPARSTQPSRR